MVHEQKFKDLLSGTCQVSVERIVLDLGSEAMRGPGSIPTGGNILSLGFFCFHIVNMKMPQLAFLCICEKPCKVGFAASFIFMVLFSITIPFYYPQTKFAKVMFLQVSVCLQGGVCVVAPGGMHGCSRGACVIAPGGCAW